MRRLIPFIVATALIVPLSIYGNRAIDLLNLGAAYKAKLLCSAVFVSGRDASDVLAEDLAVEDLSPLRWLPVDLDRENSVVAAGIPLIGRQIAQYRPGLGCTLTHGHIPIAAVTKALPQSAATAAYISNPFIESVLDWAFSEPDRDRPRRTSAVVILQDGRIVGERYGDGFGPHTPLAGWSMAKMALNALVGILVGQGLAQLEQPLNLPEWQHDGRSKITLDQLLRMSSGLQFFEEYGDPLQDVTRMLMLKADAAAFAAAKPLIALPGQRWYYASGASNIVSRWIKSVVSNEQYPAFPRTALFGPLGMHSAVLEQDAAGNFVASSFMYATARDWTKLGQLYLQDGVWNGRRLLPPGWVSYSTKPAPACSTGEYGAHIWIKVPDSYRGDSSIALPSDAFHAIGFEGQFITVIPSRRTVFVRLGLTRSPDGWPQDQFIEKALGALAK